jgi:TrpR family trp operon transcriptional repressor
VTDRGKVHTYKELIKIFTNIKEETEMRSFFEEIFTEKERNDVALRWELLKELHEGSTQRSIAAKHKISLCKITRGSKILKDDRSIIKKILVENYGEPKKN